MGLGDILKALRSPFDRDDIRDRVAGALTPGINPDASTPGGRELPGFDVNAIDQAEKPRPTLSEQRQTYVDQNSKRSVGSILKSALTGLRAGAASGGGLGGALGGAITGAAIGGVSPKTGAGNFFDQFKAPQLQRQEQERLVAEGRLRQAQIDDLNRQDKLAAIAKSGAEIQNLGSQVTSRQAEDQRKAQAFPLEIQGKQLGLQKTGQEIKTGAANQAKYEADTKRTNQQTSEDQALFPLKRQEIKSRIGKNIAETGSANRSNRGEQKPFTANQGVELGRDLADSIQQFRDADLIAFGDRSQGIEQDADPAKRAQASNARKAAQGKIRTNLQALLKSQNPGATPEQINAEVNRYMKSQGLANAQGE